MALSRLASYLLAANLAWAAGFALRRAGWTWRRCVGLAFVAFPFAWLFLRFAAAAPSLFDAAAKGPLGRSALAAGLATNILVQILLPTVGLALVLGPGDRRRRASRFLRLPVRTVAGDAMDGQALLAIAGAVFALGLWLASLLRGGGALTRASGLYDGAGPVLLIGLSLVAGVGEEFLFRGLLLGALRRRLRETPAIFLQAAAFGLAHAGQGDAFALLGPAALGLATGLVAARLGLLPAMLLHVQADLAFFAFSTKDPLLLALTGGAWLAGIVFLSLRRGQALGPLFGRPEPRSGAPSDGP